MPANEQEHDTCLLEEADQTGTAEQVPLTARARTVGSTTKRTAIWSAGALMVLLLLCPAVLVSRRARAPPVGVKPPSSPGMMLYGAEDGCESWYSVGNDCKTMAEWTCVAEDYHKNDQGYKCCCKHGWGAFKGTTGMINWASHPDRCVDITMPYVGTGVNFDTSVGEIDHCNWGNPNKQWHINSNGLIQWAGHPGKCLAPKGGGAFPGNEMHLQPCYTGDTNGKKFKLDFGGKHHHKAQQIRMMKNPSMCVSVQGGSASNVPPDGAKLVVANCKDKSSGKAALADQLFNISMPQKLQYDMVPKLFCISLMLPKGYEAGLLKAQHAANGGKGVGIFQCNDFAVYSNESIIIQNKTDSMKEVKTTVMDANLQVKFGGEWNSALNTDVFIKFWARVIEDHRSWKNDWIVKIDPDAVFFPGRLREILRNRWWSGVAGTSKRGAEEKPMYLNNCHRGMHGPIEVVSRKALEVYKKGWEKCKKGPPYEHKQEDYYFRKCWEYLKVQKIDVFNLLFENKYACDERSDTRDGRHPCFSRQVSFHPFKTIKGYFQCYDRGASMHWEAPMLINSEVPGHDNYHHA